MSVSSAEVLKHLTVVLFKNSAPSALQLRIARETATEKRTWLLPPEPPTHTAALALLLCSLKRAGRLCAGVPATGHQDAVVHQVLQVSDLPNLLITQGARRVAAARTPPTRRTAGTLQQRSAALRLAPSLKARTLSGGCSRGLPAAEYSPRCPRCLRHPIWTEGSFWMLLSIAPI